MAITAGELKAKVSTNGNGVHGKRSPKALIEFMKKTGVKMVDFKFTDVPGTWQHTSVPADQVDEETLAAGIGFDGSSIRGFQAIHESDMILKPDVDSAHVDTFCAVPTMSLVCDVFDPIARELYHRDPRNIARKAEEYLKSSGIATTAYFGPEAEFHYFDSVSYENSPNRTFYEIDSNEAGWNSGRAATLRTTYLNAIRLSAVFSSELKRKSISACPGAPTSWCCISTSMPHSLSTSAVSARTSLVVSAGAAGK